MRDSAVRLEAGIPLYIAARFIGVHSQTLRIYEIDPMGVKDVGKREQIRAYFTRLRAFVGIPEADMA